MAEYEAETIDTHMDSPQRYLRLTAFFFFLTFCFVLGYSQLCCDSFRRTAKWTQPHIYVSILPQTSIQAAT